MVESKIRRYCRFLWLFIIFVICLLVKGAYSQKADYENAARDFVAKCREDPNVFVFTPSDDANSAQKFKKFDGASALLILDFNQMPVMFESKIHGDISKVAKTWHKSGRLISEELFTGEKLLSGTYYDCNGAVLSQVKEGTGKRFVFNRQVGGEGQVAATIEYVDGLKDGTESIFQDYKRALKREETQYKHGEPHGKSIGWNSMGGLNWECQYEQGKKHGQSICWHPNGQLQSVQTYEYGQLVGKWTRYYENGKKAEEYSNLEEKKWYPSGQLMSDVKYHEPADKWTTRVVQEGVSYDLNGNETGRVIDEVGYLVETDTDRWWTYYLKVFRKHYSCQSIELPALTWSGGYSGHRFDGKIVIKSPDNFALKNVRVKLLIPDDCRSDKTLVFSDEVIGPGDSEEIGNFDIHLPVPYDKWKGEILVDVEVNVSDYRVRYQRPLLIYRKGNETN